MSVSVPSIQISDVTKMISSQMLFPKDSTLYTCIIRKSAQYVQGRNYAKKITLGNLCLLSWSNTKYFAQITELAGRNYLLSAVQISIGLT